MLRLPGNTPTPSPLTALDVYKRQDQTTGEIGAAVDQLPRVLQDIAEQLTLSLIHIYRGSRLAM